MIWFAPFQGLGEAEPFPQPPRAPRGSPADGDAPDDATDEPPQD